ncbi:hypothetical protein JCM1393_17090 [Clostridium carnis]
MNKFILIINKIINILLILFISFLILNEYYVIQFSDTLKNVFVFLTLILVLLSSTKEIITSSSGLSKFINCIILFCTIVGGVFSIVNKQLNIFIYICLLFSVTYGFVDLVYKKA